MRNKPDQAGHLDAAVGDEHSGDCADECDDGGYVVVWTNGRRSYHDVLWSRPWDLLEHKAMLWKMAV